MSFGLPRERISPTGCAITDSRRTAGLPSRLEDPTARQDRLLRGGQPDPWMQAATYPSNGSSESLRGSTPFQFSIRTDWNTRDPNFQPALQSPSTWSGSPLSAQYPEQRPTTNMNQHPRGGYPTWSSSWPAPLIRRTSSDDGGLNQYSASYYPNDASSSVTSLGGRSYPQRRPSNRDEFDGPSQLLEKPDDGGYEPKEEDLPQLPVNLFAQEQDDILAQVNDRLSRCAFDFVAKYQFPIPVEPDKRAVRVPSDREWSEWVYLLKRLATKRRIPSRVLYNGQIKQLITILENSLEMRHAAKHQSRPLKDDRNILQLISSGLQVAKILKDAEAMQHLDSLYVQTERLIQNRRATAQSAFASMSIM